MMITKEELENVPRLQRLNLINSLTGIKPANLVGTVSPQGITNLAVFSSVVHLGSHPALIGLMVRPATEVRRDTYENIKATGIYTINSVHPSFTAAAHFTSAKFPTEVSEFTACGLTEKYISGFAAPFVEESTIKFGLRFRKEIPIDLNNTILLIGEVETILLPPGLSLDDGQLNLESLAAIGISGLNTYYTVQKQAQYPYARPEETPHYLNEKETG
jgi:flavin reductase (DIM6/NTAB) family NADH-FMN oxidoreductase RutF